MPLLSIIIPTKNQQYTCIYAIESAMALKEHDIEVIVQDCSDTKILEEQILEKFGSDEKIKYYYSGDNPSMTENWNRAFANALGEYQCGIGDDDAVLPEIYAVALWAKQNNIESVGHTRDSAVYAYKWPDFDDQALKANLVITRLFDGSIRKNTDVKALVDEASNNIDLNYFRLPMVYHCLIHVSLLERVRAKTGKLLDGTAIDVYSAFVFGLLTTNYTVLDYPFTIYGACGKSNTNRTRNGKAKEHFQEFKSLKFPSIIPNIHNIHTTIAQSMYCAFKNLNRQDLIDNMDLPFLYGYSAAEGWKEFRTTLSCMRKNKTSFKVWVGSAKMFTTKVAKKTLRFFLGKKISKNLFERKTWVLVPCETISDAIDYHTENNKIQLLANETIYHKNAV